MKESTAAISKAKENFSVTHLNDFIEDKVTPAPADAVTLTILREKIEELLDVLTPREKNVLWRRFRLRQIESQAFGKLREPAQIQQLNDFIG